MSAVTTEQVIAMLGQLAETSTKTIECMEKADRQMKEFMQQTEEARSGKGGGKGGGGNEGGKTRREENLGGKTFEIFRLFAGGEAEWHEWSTDLSVLAATRSMAMREVMKKVKDLAKTEKEVMACAEVKAEMAKSDDSFRMMIGWNN